MNCSYLERKIDPQIQMIQGLNSTLLNKIFGETYSTKCQLGNLQIGIFLKVYVKSRKVWSRKRRRKIKYKAHKEEKKYSVKKLYM